MFDPLFDFIVNSASTESGPGTGKDERKFVLVATAVAIVLAVILWVIAS